MILFQSRDIDHRLVKALRKFCINSTSMYPEHSATPEVFTNLHLDIYREGYHRRTQASLR
jgi:hypothetical protein